MQPFEETLVSLPDQYQAYARCWRPAEPRGAVLFHHGIQSHCGWYEASPQALVDAGYVVLQVDRRGCGRNQQDRGHADSADQLIADATAARDALARLSGFQECHVVGVSWGGKLAVAAFVRDPSGVRSLSLVTPGLFPRVGVSKDQMASVGFAMLYEPRRSFAIPLNDPDRFTKSSSWQEFFQSDPLTLRECTAGFYLASRRMDKLVAKLAEAPPVPLHVQLAGDEQVIDNNKTTAFVEGLAWPQCRIETYPEARHSLEFDAREAFLSDLTSFLEGVDGAPAENR